MGYRSDSIAISQGQKGTPKNFSDKDFTELSGELSGVICLKTLVLLGGVLELFRKFLVTVRAAFWLWGLFWLLNIARYGATKFKRPSENKYFKDLGP